MAVRTISTKLAVEGEAEYKQKIASCNSELKTLKSSLALVQSEYKNNANSMEALTAKGEALNAMQTAQSKKVAELEKALANCQKAQTTYADRVAEAEANVSKYEQALAELKNSTGDTAEEQEALTAELEKWKNELNDAQAGQAAAERGVQNWQQQLNKAKIDLNDTTDAIDRNNQYLAEAKQSADGCATSIDKFGKEVKDAGKEVKDAGEESEDFGKKSTNAINTLAAALAAAGVSRALGEIADVLKECVSASAGFEEAMSAVKALSGANAAEFQKLSEMAKQMGETTKYTAAESAEAFQYMALAGWNTEEMLEGIAPILNLASAANMDLARASDIVTDYLTAFGLTAADSAAFADKMAYAMSHSNTSADQLGEAYKGCAATAESMGYSVEETTAALMVMANASVKGGDAGTALNAIMTRLATDTKDCASTLAEYGVNVYDSQGNMQSLSSILQGISQVWATLTNEQQANLAKSIAGTNHYSDLQTILKGCSDAAQETGKSFTDYAAALETCSGSAEEMAGTMLDNLNGKMTLMNSALDSLKISIGNALMPVLGELADAGADGFSWASKFVDENPWLVQSITGAVGAVALLAGGLTAYAAVTAAAKAVQDALNLSMSLCPAVAIAAAIGALVVVVGSWVASLDDADESTKAFTESLEETKTAYEELSATMAEEQATTAATADSLKSLLEVEEKSATQKELIKQKVDELNEAVPNLGLAYDAASDSINMTTEALDALVEHAAAQEEYEAQVARLSELYTEQAEITARLEEAQTALAEAQETGSGNTWTLQNNINELTASLEDNQAQIAALEEESAAFGEWQEKSSQATQEMTTTVSGLISEMEALQTAYEDSHAKAVESIEGQLGLFNELDGSAKTSIDNLIETLKGQVSYMETYAANIQKAMELGVDEGLVKKLSDGSEESAQILAAIVAGGEDEIAALNEQLAKVEEGKNAFGDAVAEMETDFSDKMADIEKRMQECVDELDVSVEAGVAGAATIEGYIEGAESMRSSLVSTYRSLARAANNAYKSTLDINSPSRVFREHGKNTVRGAIEGVEEEKDSFERVYTALAEAAVRAYERGQPKGTEADAVAAQQKQTAALVAAAAVKQDGGAPVFQFHIDKMEVRDDEDVHRVAQELYYMTEREKRSRGGGSL